jgi:hypothetical protein
LKCSVQALVQRTAITNRAIVPLYTLVDDPEDNTGFSRTVSGNDFGIIVGTYQNVSNNVYTLYGFKYVIKNAAFTTFSLPNFAGTQLAGINDLGHLVGLVVPTTGQDEGFLLTKSTPSFFILNNEDTFGQGINLLNDITLVTVDSNNNVSSYLRTFYGKVTDVSYPGATSSTVLGVNIFDDVVGGYLDSSGNEHGYLWTAHNDKFSSFDIPGATQTGAGGLNDRGQIVGHYVDTNGNYVGYRLTPICASTPNANSQ